MFGAAADDAQPPRVFIAPQRYIQGPGVIDKLGDFVTLVGAERVAVLTSRRGRQNEGARAQASLTRSGVESRFVDFGGECTLDEIEGHSVGLRGTGIEALVALGGGKCVDTGKAIAHRLEIPVVVVPTLASNDAPCSASSILYGPDGVFAGLEFYPDSPALVVVDSGIIAAAPERFLVAGMGDAMATWYEARVALANPDARSSIGGRPSIASAAIGEACAGTLFEHGVNAAAAAAEHTLDESLEEVIEANTLLSGLGFESGGLAAAHGVAQSFTGVDVVHDRYLHGEMVAFGLVTQLAMEDRVDEAARVAEFFTAVGLPVHLDQLSVSSADDTALNIIATGTVAFPMTANMPFPVDELVVRSALAGADEIGRNAVDAVGDDAYRRLHEPGP